MEEHQNSGFPQDHKNTERLSDKMEKLKEKENVDQAAIDEAREAVGDDEDKIREYLINTRGM